MSKQGYSPELQYIHAEKAAGRTDGSLYLLLTSLQALANQLDSEGALKVLAANSDNVALKDMAALAVPLRQQMLALLRKKHSAPLAQ